MIPIHENELPKNILPTFDSSLPQIKSWNELSNITFDGSFLQIEGRNDLPIYPLLLKFLITCALMKNWNELSYSQKVVKYNLG